MILDGLADNRLPVVVLRNDRSDDPLAAQHHALVERESQKRLAQFVCLNAESPAKYRAIDPPSE